MVPPLRYTATDLGSPPESKSQRNYVEASAINNAGQVVGVAQSGFGNLTEPFLWTPAVSGGNSGTMLGLGLLPDPNFGWGGVNSINDAGQVAGYCCNANYSQAFIWTPSKPNGTTGIMTGLPNPPGTAYGGRVASGINNVGQVVGVDNAGGHGLVQPSAGTGVFLYQPDSSNSLSGTVHEISDANTYAPRINSHGQMLFNNALFTPSSARDGSYVQTLVASAGTATGLNERGQVIGYMTVGDGTVSYLWTPDTPNGPTGHMTTIDAGGESLIAAAINNAGQVVGIKSPYGKSAWSLFLWDPNAGIVDLNSTLTNTLGDWTLTNAVGINDMDEIVAIGVERVSYAGGKGVAEIRHSFLLTPDVPEPALELAGTMIVVLAMVPRLRRAA